MSLLTEGTLNRQGVTVDGTDAAAGGFVAVSAVSGGATAAFKIRPSDRLFPVTSGAAISAIVAEIVAAGAGTLWVPPGVTVSVAATIDAPAEVGGLRVDGEVVVTASVPLLTRSGTVVGSSANITSTIAAGARTVSAIAPAGLAVGDCVFVASADTLPGTTDKLGYLRFVRAIDATTVSLDSPIPRNMPDSTRRLQKVTLAGPFTVSGNGVIRYDNPSAYTASMFQFTFARDVTIAGPTLRDGGGRCVELSHVAGFRVDTTIDNFVDDLPNGHVGYGVDVCGASRDGRVTGRISRCRHAVTTNVGSAHPAFNFYGEPENFVADPVTHRCTDKALDTHRAGWGITLRVSDKGSGGGVQVRADMVTVSGITEGNYIGAGLAVGPDLIAPPLVGPLRISGNRGATTIDLASPAVFAADPVIYNCAGTPYNLAAGVKPSLPPKRLMVRKAADQSVTASVTLVADTELSLAVDANTNYEVEAFLIMAAPAAADARVAWSAPAGASLDWTPQGLSTGTTSTGGSVVLQHRTLVDDVAVGTVAAGTKTVARVTGILAVGATAGSLGLRWAQWVSDPVATVIYAGSTVTLARLP